MITKRTSQKPPAVPKQRSLPVYLSIQEAAEVMAVNPKTIRRRISTGVLPAYRYGSRNLRVRLDDLESTLRRVPATGQ
jgi:excisionase family DNA binding protein